MSLGDMKRFQLDVSVSMLRYRTVELKSTCFFFQNHPNSFRDYHYIVLPQTLFLKFFKVLNPTKANLIGSIVTVLSVIANIVVIHALSRL